MFNFIKECGSYSCYLYQLLSCSHCNSFTDFTLQVTGKAGLMARSVVKDTVNVTSGTWHNSSVHRGWLWKGDTSSDEVIVLQLTGLCDLT